MTSVSSEFHTHHATPQQLFRELKILLGDDAQFKVEMRHNIYNIETSQDLDLVRIFSILSRLSMMVILTPRCVQDALYNRCTGRRRRVPRLPASAAV